jgi:hypothetical protein
MLRRLSCLRDASPHHPDGSTEILLAHLAEFWFAAFRAFQPGRLDLDQAK